MGGLLGRTRALLRRAARARHGLTPQRLLLASVLVALGVAVAWAPWADIVRVAARDEEQSHVFLAPVVVGWLVWVRRGRLRGFMPRATWAGPALVALGWALTWVGDRHLVESFWHLGAIVVAVGCLLTVAGGNLVPRFLPAFAALLFLVPVPGVVRHAVAFPLQTATASMTHTLLDTVGVAVARTGNALSVNGRDVEIAEACNGLRLVFALAMVTYAFAFGVPLRGGVRALVLVLSPIVAVFFNVVRLVPTVWAYGAFETSTAAFVHDVSGWLMPPCAFVTLLGLMRLLRWARVPVTHFVLAHAA